MNLLSADEHTGSSRAQPSVRAVNFLELILGNEIEYDGLAPEVFDSYENAIRPLEVEIPI